MKRTAFCFIALMVYSVCGFAQTYDYTYDVLDSTTQTVDTVLTGSSEYGLLKTGGGELILNASNTYTGITQINAGTVTLKVTGKKGTLATGSTVIVEGASTVLRGNGDILGYGTGPVGTLNLNNGASLVNNSTDKHITVDTVINMNNGKITADTTAAGSTYGNFVFDETINALSGTDNAITGNNISFRHYGTHVTGGVINVAQDAKLSINAIIKTTTTDGFTKTGAGELVLTSKNTFTGPININAGTVTLTAAGERGTFYTDTTVTVDGTSTVLQGNGDVLGYGTGSVRTLNLNNGASLVNNSTNNHITVDTVINMNNGKITADTTAPGSDQYGNFDFGETINAQSGTDNTITANTISFRHYGTHETGGVINVAQDAKLSINAIIKTTTTDGITKTGAGTLTLSGANTFTGGMTISEGKVSVATGSTSLGNGALTLDFGATLIITGGELNNTLNIPGTATLNGIFDLSSYLTTWDQSKTYTLITAESISGTSSLQGTPEGWLHTVGDNNIVLNYVGNTNWTWTGALNASFNNPGNWDKGNEPVLGSDVIIHSGTTNTANVDSDASVKTVALDAASNLKFTAGKTLTAQSMTINGENQTLDLTGGNLTLITAPAFNIDNSDTENASTLTLSSGKFTNVLSGNTNLSKIGAGTLTLSNTNTYTGTTTISGGTLDLETNNAIESSSSVINNAIINFGTTSQKLLNLSGTGTITGETGGALELVNLTSTYTGTISGSGAVTMNITDSSAEWNGTITDTTRITKTGIGTLTLSGENTYSGGTTISDGRIIATNDSALGTGTVTNNSELEFNLTTDGTYGKVISGTGKLIKNGTGNLTLSAYNTYTGETQINAGTVTLTAVGKSGTFATGTTVTVDGASTVLQAAGGDVLGYWRDTVSTVNLNNGATLKNTNTGTHLTISATVNMNNGKIVAAGNGSNIFGAFVFDKPINVIGGTDNAISGGTISFRAGTLDNGKFTATGGEIDVVSDAKLTISSLIIDNDNSKPGITKTGAGELVLTKNNTFTGPININAGTVTLTATGKSGTFATGTTVTVDGASTVLQGNGGDVFGYYNESVSTVNLNNGATLKNTNTGAHITMSATVNMNNGKIVAAGNGSNNFGAFGFDKPINVTGGTDNTISGGTISFRAGTLDNGKFTATGGEIDVAQDAKLTISSLIIDNDNSKPGITKTGAGELVLTKNNTFTGPININAGTVTLTATGESGTFYTGTTVTVDGASTVLQAAGGDVLGYWGDTVSTVNLKNGATLKNTNTGTHLTISATVNMNNGKIVAAGNGSNNFGAFVFDKPINVIGGTDNAISGGTISFRAGEFSGFLTTGGRIDVAQDAKLTISSIIKDNDNSKPGITKTGAGTLTLSNANTYTGATTVSAGSLDLTVADAIASSASVANNAAITFATAQTFKALSGTGTITGSGALTLVNDTDSSYSGTINGIASVNKTGTGTLTLSGANTYTGATTISAGTLDLTVDDAIASSASVANNAAITFATAQTFKALSGSGTITGSGALTLVNDIDSSYSGTINGTASVNKTGTGTLTLSGDSTFTGGMTISAGKVSVATISSSLGDGALTLDTGATLIIIAGDFNNTLAISGTATLNGTLDLTNYLFAWDTSKDYTLMTAGSIDSTEGLTLSGVGTGWGWEQSGASILLKYSSGTLGWNWKGTTDSFKTAANWENNEVPVATSDVTITKADGKAQIDENAEVKSVTLGNASNLEFTAGKTLTAQTMTMGGTDALNLTGGNLTLTNAPAFDITNSDTTNASTLTLSSGTYTNVLSGNTNLSKSGDGTLTLSGANTYTGTTTVNAGKLVLTGAANLETSEGVIIAAGAEMDLSGISGTQHYNVISSEGTIKGNNNTILDIDVASSQERTLTGSVSGIARINKSGEGTLKMNLGQDSAPLVIRGGIFSTDGIFNMQGYYFANISILGGTFSPGMDQVGIVNQMGNFALSDEAVLKLDLVGKNGGYFTFDQLDVYGNVEFSTDSDISFLWNNILPSTNGTFDLITATVGTISYSDDFNWNTILTNAGMNTDLWSVEGTPNALRLIYSGGGGGESVPEPSTWALLILGALGMMYFRRRK